MKHVRLKNQWRVTGNSLRFAAETGEIFAELGDVEAGRLQVLDGSVDELGALANTKRIALMVECGNTGVDRDGELKGAAIAVLPVGFEPRGADARAQELLPKGEVFGMTPAGSGKRRGSDDQSLSAELLTNVSGTVLSGFHVGVQDVGA